MKKIYLILVLVILLAFSSCSLNSLSPERITTDAVTMHYNNISYSLVLEDEDIVKEITAFYNTLKLKKVNKELDFSSTINIVFYENKKEKAVLAVDKNGLIYLYRDTDNVYKVVNKNFNYEHLEEIYETYKDKQ